MKIAIVGTAPSVRLAPYNDPEWKIWMLGGSNFALGLRFDRWWELHTLEQLLKVNQQNYLGWLSQQTKPVYVQDERVGPPHKEVFPIESLKEAFPHAESAGFWSSTIAYLLAYAITCKPTEIGLWGVNMDNRGVPGLDPQKAGCHYFITKALESDIGVVLPPHTSLMTGERMYGYHKPDAPEIRMVSRRDEVAEKLRTIDANLKDLNAQRDHFSARMAEVEYAIKERYWMPKE